MLTPGAAIHRMQAACQSDPTPRPRADSVNVALITPRLFVRRGRFGNHHAGSDRIDDTNSLPVVRQS
jgi:hypothetical protein